MPIANDTCCVMPRLLAARRRYSELRAALPCDCAIDNDLHAELTDVIRILDAKIARTSAAPCRQRRRATSSSPGTGAPSS